MTDCACEKCKNMCRHRPCWPTPDEAQKIIEAGHKAKLMLDYWAGDGPDGDDIMILAPAVVGYEGQSAPWWPNDRCVFLDNNDLCQLHHTGFKPMEGRLAMCDGSGPDNLHETVAMTWNNPQAQALVHQWQIEREED